MWNVPHNDFWAPTALIPVQYENLKTIFNGIIYIMPEHYECAVSTLRYCILISCTAVLIQGFGKRINHFNTGLYSSLFHLMYAEFIKRGICICEFVWKAAI